MTVPVVLRDRNLGKTTELVNWLLDGHPINGWPGWSRVLVVTPAGATQSLVRNRSQFGEADLWLRKNGLPAGLQKIVVTADDWPRLSRGIARDVEWALDDAEQIIARQLGGLPAVMSMTGEAR